MHINQIQADFNIFSLAVFLEDRFLLKPNQRLTIEAYRSWTKRI